MALLSRTVAIKSVLTFLLLQLARGLGPAGYEIDSVRCGLKDTPDSNCQDFVLEVTSILRKHTAEKGYSYYYDTEWRECFGFASCHYNKLSPHDCINCLNEAWMYMERFCGFSIGAELLLSDCEMRYEKYDFKYHKLPRRPSLEVMYARGDLAPQMLHPCRHVGHAVFVEVQ